MKEGFIAGLILSALAIFIPGWFPNMCWQSFWIGAVSIVLALGIVGLFFFLKVDN